MNKWFLSLVLLSFGTSVFAQSMAQTNPFNYYKSDNIFKTDIKFIPKNTNIPLIVGVQTVNLNNDLSRSEEHNISGQYNLKILGGSAGVRYSNNKDFLSQNITERIGINYNIEKSNYNLFFKLDQQKPNYNLKDNNQIITAGGIIKF
jgi:hypothetical protein